MNFEKAFTRLLGHEGRYANHPFDPGGETCWGVTVAVARANGYEGLMRDLTVDQARVIYRREYWDSCKADLVSDQVKFPLFDGAVNSGVSQSIKWLQIAVGVTDDGVIGPVTLAAEKMQNGAVTVAKMLGHRLQFMSSLPTWQSFGRGWANRIAKNLIEA